MKIVIESFDPEVIRALSEAAKSMKATFRIEPDTDVVTEADRKRRVELMRKFKGGLKKYFKGYQPGNGEWYEQ